MKRLLFRKKKNFLSKSFEEDKNITINTTLIFKLLKKHGFSVKLKDRKLFGYTNACTCDPDDTEVCNVYVAQKGSLLFEFAITVDKIDSYHYKIKFKYDEASKRFVEEELIPEVILKNKPQIHELALAHNDHLDYLMNNVIFKKEVFVIGSVHGCYHTLKALLSRFPNDADIIFTGNVCDFGNYTKDVIELIIENNYSCVRGNHENYFLENYNNPQSEWATVPEYGGGKTLESYKDSPELLKKHIEWIKILPPYIELHADNYAHFFISHGYGRPYFRRRHTDYADDALIHNHYLTADYKWDYESFENNAFTHIFSHDIVDDVLIADHGKMQKDFGLNTGAVLGKKLTAIELNTLQIYSQETDPRDIA